jgi:hypothetical protein
MEGAHYDHYYNGDAFIHFKEYQTSLIFSSVRTGEITCFDKHSVLFD